MNSHRQLLRPAATALPAVGAALLIVACGGAKKPPPASVSGHGSSNSGVNSAYHYADCMRSHGVSAFQDPHVSQHGNSMSIGFRVDPQITGSPAFKSAQTACAHILPGLSNGPTPAQSHAREQAILAFAGCMRRHGFPKFPDPTMTGQLTPAMLSQSGIDLQQPAIRPAAYACLPLTHGIITRADVDQAIAHPNGSSSQSGG